MNRFALPEFTAVIVEHINVRDETHGDDRIPAIDVKLTLEVHNSVLNLFHPALRKFLYFKSSRPRSPEQGTLELDEPNDLPDLRFPNMGPLKWHEDLEGQTLTLDYGIAGKSNVKIADCKANAFRIECKQGGTVKVTWRVQRSDPDERAIGKLSSMLKREVQAMLLGSPETVALMGSSTDDEGKLDATEAFIAQHNGSGAAMPPP